MQLMCDKLLTPLEPRMFSKTNLKDIAPYGVGYQKNQEELSKYVEYMTGFGPDFPLNGIWADFSVLVPAMKKLNAFRGHRARNLPFPVQWSAAGEYMPLSYCKKRKVILVKKIHEDIEEEVPSTSLSPFTSISQITVTTNWSDKRATLSIKGAPSPSDPGIFEYFKKTCQNPTVVRAPSEKSAVSTHGQE